MTRSWVTVLLLLGLSTFATPARGQVCGDADGSGTVSVSDGVQTLRAAAGLATTCTNASCDVDGSGAVTVTDGVSVLRKAAGLPITENCSGGSGAQPDTVLRELQPVLKYGLAHATGAPVSSCANAPDGTIDVETDPEDGTTTFYDTCQVDDVELSGDVTVADASLAFSFFEADTVGDEDFISDFDGELTMSGGSGGRTLNGPIDVTTESAGTLTMTLADVVVANGVLTSGTATVEFADSDIPDMFQRTVLKFDGSGIAIVTATQANGGTSTYRLDIATGNLVQ